MVLSLKKTCGEKGFSHCAAKELEHVVLPFGLCWMVLDGIQILSWSAVAGLQTGFQAFNVGPAKKHQIAVQINI